MNRFSRLAALVLLMGCGPSRTKFHTDFPRAVCSWEVQCLQAYTDVDACLSDNPIEGLSSACSYDRTAARDCLHAVEALTCDNTIADYPTSCADVYACPSDSGQ